MEIEIQHLFVIPVIKSKERYSFNDDELNYIMNIDKKQNVGNTRSIDSYILNNVKLRNIREFIEKGIQKYVDNIICPLNKELEFYITQSWLNYTKSEEYHHQHRHPNSLISGCLYVNAVKDVDTITFFNDNYKRIDIPTDNFNSYNTDSWWIPIETGQLILFDSSLKHMVENTKSKETRISISFNVFIKGTIGKELQIVTI
jgi:uncharacterized protein (TIGR02466 family)